MGVVGMFAAARGLSIRETQVLVAFASEGRTTKEIAAGMGIAYQTVRQYWARICAKLGCRDPAAALVLILKDVVGRLPHENEKSYETEMGFGPLPLVRRVGHGPTGKRPHPEQGGSRGSGVRESGSTATLDGGHGDIPRTIRVRPR